MILGLLCFCMTQLFLLFIYCSLLGKTQHRQVSPWGHESSDCPSVSVSVVQLLHDTVEDVIILGAMLKPLGS